MVPFDTLLLEIKKRKEVKHEQALSLLTMAALPGESKNRISFLNLVERQLEQTDVFTKWVGLTLHEQDDVVREYLMKVLSSFSYSGKLKRQHAELLVENLDTLALLVEHLSLRVSVLNIISGLLTFDGARTGGKLAEIYDKSDSESYKWAIFGLIYYVRHTWEGAAEFLLQRFEDSPLEYRAGILSFLFKRNAIPIENQLRLLRFVPELDYARHSVTQHYLNSTASLPVALVANFVQVMQKDPIVLCRQNAARVLIRHGHGLSEALELLKVSDQSEFKNTLFQELVSVDQGSTEFLNSLLDFLTTEKDIVLIRDIINHLFPKISDDTPFGDSLRKSLLDLTGKNITIEFAELVFNVLSLALRSHGSLRAHFVLAYEMQNRDELRALILYRLAEFCEKDESIQRLVREGLCSMSHRVRHAALAGILTLPVTASFYELILHAVPLLTDKELKADLRERLAARMSIISTFSEDVKLAIKAILPFMENKAAREKLDSAISTIQSAASQTDEPEWDVWLSKIVNEKTVKGIFPAVYISFDKNPAKARAVLEALLADRRNLNLGFFSDPLGIFEFLVTKGMGDKKLMAWVWEYFLTLNDHAGDQVRRCLGIFKTCAAAKIRREDMWKFMEREQVKICGSVALIDTFLILFDGEKNFVGYLKDQLNQIVSSSVYTNYVKLFEACSTWPWVKDCVIILMERAKTNPAIVHGSSNSSQHDILTGLCKLLGIFPSTEIEIKSVQLQQPGLLDD